ncbi:MAG TPA: IS4 family transposase [Bacteroidales bacterium]|nr:IS4 family transposase [Bacteroidales bacterium]
MKFKEDGIGVSDLLKLIPDDLLLDLAKETKVDYQVKKLYGRNVFNLLLYGLLTGERVGLRSLEDFYNSRKFKAMFKLPGTPPNARYNSLSARLATMNVSYFEKAYEAIHEQCSLLYDEPTLSLHYRITRVDSTMVCQTAAKLEQGIRVGVKKDGKKQVKYTISLTDMFPSSVEIFTQQKYICESLTIPKVILKVMDKSKDNVFVFDRGVSSRDVFYELDTHDCSFVTRLQVDARHVVLNDIAFPPGLVVRNLTVLKDQCVYLYRSGNHVLEHPFRLIQTQNAKGIQYWFLTNRFDLTCQEIILIYKHRWDIEVFFRFIKQELNFSHLISVNENGIKILLYMTLILAMLILIYKKINEFGYKTAKRRFAIELGDIIDDVMIEQSGGDPNTFFR